MIIDSLENWSLYFSGDGWRSVFDFLSTLDSESLENEYPIKSDKIFARVLRYKTVDLHDGVFEAHHNYIDIQTVLSGAEGIAWCQSKDLKIHTPYSVKNDVEFYCTPKKIPAQVDLYSGSFVALFPHDAHMPQLKVAGMTTEVKKVVIKVHTSLYPVHRG